MRIKPWLQSHSTLLQIIFITFIALIIGWAVLSPNDKRNKFCFIELKRDTVERGGLLPVFYQYVDGQDNQTKDTSPTKAYVITPDGKKIVQKEISNMLAVFPDDFPGADSNVFGKYELYFENSSLSCNARKQFTVLTGNPKAYATPAESETNAYLDVNPERITTGGEVSFDYGYMDKLNNEHLNSATTTITVETPSGKKFQANNAKNFPSDFKGANTMESGIYVVNVVRKIKTTNGSYDILFQSMSGFQVK